MNIKIVRTEKGETGFDFINIDKKKIKKLFFIRHDIDRCLLTALKMATIENEYNIRSTFFILLTGPYMSMWIEDDISKTKLISILKKIEGLGHEIGLHYDMYGEYFTNNKNCELGLNTLVKLLRENGINIKGCVAHGGTVKRILNSRFTHKYVNYTIWKELFPTKQVLKCNNKKLNIPACSLKSHELQYEAYFIGKHSSTISRAYISDGAGFFWGVHSASDNIKTGTVASPINLIDYINKIKNADIISLLTHPHMWLNGAERNKIMPNELKKDIKNFKI